MNAAARSSEPLETELALVRFDDGVMFVTIRDGAMVTEETVATLTDGILERWGSQVPCRTVVDLTAAHGSTPAGRREGRERFIETVRLALVVGSPVARFLGNAFVRLGISKNPVRLFDDPAEALAWVRED